MTYFNAVFSRIELKQSEVSVNNLFLFRRRNKNNLLTIKNKLLNETSLCLFYSTHNYFFLNNESILILFNNMCFK
jgi:hypothetical protein